MIGLEKILVVQKAVLLVLLNLEGVFFLAGVHCETRPNFDDSPRLIFATLFLGYQSGT